ncbi:MAG: SurA N-terminal domain-containing protein [Thermodesulfobacteriota bacterium]
MAIDSEPIDRTACPFCGGGNERGARFCVHCGNRLSIRKENRFKKRYIFFGAASLILIGATVFFWRSGFGSKWVGRVNGEGIARKEFSKRVDLARRFYESRYGQGLFEGQQGSENLNRLKTELLDEIITEKILLQEARNAGYTSAPEEEIARQIEAIKKEYGLSDEELKKMHGGEIENLKSELRKEWTLSQFIEKAVLKGDRTNAKQLFTQWLSQARAKARIETYEKLEPVLTAKPSCCRSGCGGGSAQPLDPKIEKEAKAKGLEYYEKKTQKKGASAKVTDFGCHIQVDIIEDGKVVVSLTYNGGEVQEI